MGNESSQEAGGNKKAYGISGIVTDSLNNIMPRLWKNRQGLMIINQQRQAGSFNGNTLYEAPGGEGIKHHAQIRIHIKQGSNKYTAKIDGEKVLVGRELACKILKCQLSQATNRVAKFDFFHIDTEEYGLLGIDHTGDIINVGKVTGVIKGSSWLEHPSFPKGKLQGKAAVAEFIEQEPKVLDTIREEVLERMTSEEKALREDGNEG